jgi:hypothetical protein
LSYESIRALPSSHGVELVKDGAFGETFPGDATHLEEIAHQLETRSANRISLFLGHRKLRFVQRRGLDALKGIQDVQVGTEAFIGVGRAWGVELEGREKLPDDTHTQLSLFAGGISGNWTINTGLRAEARHVHPLGSEAPDWRDIFAEADAFVYWHPRREGIHTLLFRLSAAGGWDVHTPFQLTLGGKEGLRGYNEERFPGGRRIILTVEDRVYLPWPAPELFDFGLSLFVDGGYMQPGDVPFGVNSGWKASLGAGIRFGLPPGTRTMTRVDLALPVKKRLQLKDLVLRVSLKELLGILPGVADRQVLRSLRNGVRPTIITLPW